MNNQMNRTLTILADGEPVTGYARARVIGTERMGLYPLETFGPMVFGLSECYEPRDDTG